MTDHPPMANPGARHVTKAENWLFRVENRLWGEIEKLEPRPEDHGSNSVLVGVGFALLEVRDELRRLNEGRDQFHETVADLLVRLAKPEPGPCPSRTPLITFDNGPLPQQSCLLRDGHGGMHESVEGSRWTDDDCGSPVGSGQPAAASDGQEGGEPR